MSNAELKREQSDAETVSATPEIHEHRSRELGLDQLFEVLQNQRRRCVLKYLREHEEATTLSDLSEQIAAWENDKEVRRISSSERKRVYVALYQCHLPKMDDMGVVEFEKARGTIEPGEHIERCYEYLDVPESGSDLQWPRYYAALAAGTLAMLLVGAGLQTLLSVPAISAGAGLALLAFATTSVWHFVSEGPATA
ncbi:hypothetical protein BRC87_02895 [Halobacteriales archaeon QS_4_66_20]|nr:MAG: hypothetical protein BRC87_02895 [Halobacteriales archaeon QS_4_66_20]